MAVPTSAQIAEAYGANFMSKNSTYLSDNFKQKVFKRYGNMSMFLGILQAGAKESVPSQDLKIVEKYFPERPLVIRDAIATNSAGQSLTIYVKSTNYDANTRHQIRGGDVIVIPSAYTSSGVEETYRVSATMADDALTDDTLTCVPFRNGSVYTKAQIGTEVPAGTALMVAYNAFARGTDQPKGTTDSPTNRTYTSGLIKETKEFDGGALAHQFQIGEMDGNKWLISEAMIDAEFKLEGKMEKQLLMGQRNDNASLVQTASISSDSGTVRSTDGILTWLAEAGQSKYYSSAWAMSDFRVSAEALTSQGVATSNVAFYQSPQLAFGVDDIARDYIKEYSGGSDLYDKAKQKLGITPKVFHYGDVNFHLCTIPSLANPSSYGIETDQYSYATCGFMVPDATVSVSNWANKKDVTIPNVGIGYVNNNGENRERVIGQYHGMNGVFSNNLVATGVDGYKLFYLSEFMLFGAEWNKMIYWRKS